MSKFWIVFKQEYAQVVKKKSFLVGLIITPLFLFAMMFGPALLAKKKSSTTEHLAVVDRSEHQLGQKFINTLADYKLDDSLTQYYAVDELFEVAPDENESFNRIEDSLKKVILNNDLKYIVVITPEALSSDTGVYLISSADNIVTYQRFRWQLSRVISAQRLQSSNINIPIDSVLDMTQRIDLLTKDIKGETISFDKKFIVALIFVLLMYMLILINGQMVMRSVIDEKNSRIMEVLVSSVSPFQLMLGKIFGLGAATLTQVLIWIVAGVGFMLFGGGMAGNELILQKVVFNPYIIVYFVIFLILGFLLYSSIFALLGSVVGNEKEAQNFIFPIVMCLMLPVLMGMYIVQEPNALLSRILSFIPVFTPTMMVMRLNIILPTLLDYSFLQNTIIEANLAVLVLAAAVIGMVWATAKVFRVGILMYGKRATLPEIIKWVKQ